MKLPDDFYRFVVKVKWPLRGLQIDPISGIENLFLDLPKVEQADLLRKYSGHVRYMARQYNHMADQIDSILGETE